MTEKAAQWFLSFLDHEITTAQLCLESSAKESQWHSCVKYEDRVLFLTQLRSKVKGSMEPQ